MRPTRLPASVFGSTTPSLMDSSCLQGSLGSHGIILKAKSSPKKRDPTAKSKPQVDLVSNNNEEFDTEKSATQTRINNNVHVERTRELAALLLQRQVQVWLLQRQEKLRLQEVQRLRGDLREAAVCAIKASYKRYIKRRAISNYLQAQEKLETRLDELLKRCIVRKRQMEEVQRFATLRRQQKQQEEEQKRHLVRDWLVLCVQTRNKKKDQAIAKAHEKLIGWVRRWTLRKRCEARIFARQEEERRCSSAQIIVAVYQAYRLCRNAKEVIQHRRRMRDGLMKLFDTFHLIVLRAAHFRWYDRIHKGKMAYEAATKLQRIYQVQQVRARYVQIRESCFILQRVVRVYLARVRCAELRRRKLQELTNHQRHAAAITIQRCIRGHQTRLWFRDVLLKLRERFRCANCGAIEPGGVYCKYCGRHRTTFGPLSNVLLLHEKWQLRRSASSSKAGQDDPAALNEFSRCLTPVVPSLRKPKLPRSRSTSLRNFTASSSGTIDTLQHLTTLPVLSPRHRRLVVRKGDRFGHSNLLAKVNVPLQRSISSITEQTALRAIALSDLQAKCTASAQANVLEMHISRLQKANVAANRGTLNRRASFD